MKGERGMGRPREIGLSVGKTRGRIVKVEITGRCAHTMRGMLQLDQPGSPPNPLTSDETGTS